MYCPKCGSSVPGGEKFCTNCGSSIVYDSIGAENAQEISFKTEPAKPKKGSRLIKAIAITTSVVVVVAALGVSAYAFLRVPVKRVFMSDNAHAASIINRSTDDLLEKGLPIPETLPKTKLETKTVITYKPGEFIESQLSTMPEVLDLLKNIKIEQTQQVDTAAEITNLDLAIKNKNEALISAQVGSNKDKMAVGIKNLLQEGYMVDLSQLAGPSPLSQYQEIYDLQKDLLETFRPLIVKYRKIILTEALTSDNVTFAGKDDDLGISCYRYDIDLTPEIANKIIKEVMTEAEDYSDIVDTIMDAYKILNSSSFYTNFVETGMMLPSEEELRAQLEEALNEFFTAYNESPNTKIDYEEKVIVSLWFDRRENIVGFGVDVKDYLNFVYYNLSSGAEHILGLNLEVDEKEIINLECNYTHKGANLKGDLKFTMNPDYETLTLTAEFDLTEYKVADTKLYHGSVEINGNISYDGMGTQGIAIVIDLEKLNNGVKTSVTLTAKAQGATVDLGTLEIEITLKALDKVDSILDGKTFVNAEEIEKYIDQNAAGELEEKLQGLLGDLYYYIGGPSMDFEY